MVPAPDPATRLAPLVPYEPPLLMALQGSATLGIGAIAGLTGLPASMWIPLMGVFLGTAAFAGWRRRRGPGPLALQDIRRLCVLASLPLGLAVAALNLGLSWSTLPPSGRAAVGIGTWLAASMGVGVLTLCGLSLGLGADAPVTAILPDPAHPGPRRPTGGP